MYRKREKLYNLYYWKAEVFRSKRVGGGGGKGGLEEILGNGAPGNLFFPQKNQRERKKIFYLYFWGRGVFLWLGGGGGGGGELEVRREFHDHELQEIVFFTTKYQRDEVKEDEAGRECTSHGKPRN